MSGKDKVSSKREKETGQCYDNSGFVMTESNVWTQIQQKVS